MTLDWALRAVLLVGVPAAVMLAVISGPLLSTLFQYGKFDGFAVTMARKSLTAFAVGIAPFMLVKVLAAGFYAKQNMRTPVRIGLIAMVANALLNISLIWPLAHAGIALSTSLAALVNAGLLFYFLRKERIYQPRDGWLAFGLRLGLANAVMGAWLWFGAGELSDWITHHAAWRFMHLGFLFLSSVALYFAVLWVSGVRFQHLLMPPERQAVV